MDRAVSAPPFLLVRRSANSRVSVEADRGPMVALLSLDDMAIVLRGIGAPGLSFVPVHDGVHDGSRSNVAAGRTRLNTSAFAGFNRIVPSTSSVLV
jgi:hypothetical protein